MKKSNMFILIIVSTILCFTQTISAKTFHVADGRELFLAFSEASNNGEDDIIYLAAGVYKGEFIFETSEANSLTLTSEPGLKAEQVVFDGEEMVRPLYFFSGVETDFEVGNISIRNGKIDGEGGGIHINTYANINFYTNIIANNSGHSGGGAYIKSNGNGKLSITKNKITDNSSISSGGGIFAYSKGYISFVKNTVTNNKILSKSSSSSGGGIYSRVTIDDILFTNNNVSENTSSSYGYSYGGGISAYASGKITLEKNNVTKNTSSAVSSYGGGIYANASGDIFITNNNVTKNISSSSLNRSHGGGIYGNTSGEILLTKNNVSGNTCSSSYHTCGGAIYFDIDVQKINAKENTICYNSSELGGGICSNISGNLVLSENTINQNNFEAIRSTNASSIKILSNTVIGTNGTGIYVTSSSDISITCSINNNVIQKNNNNQLNEGSGIFVENYKLIDIRQNLIANNKAAKGAGVYLNPKSTLFLINNTIATNTAETQGGGIYVRTYNMLNDLSLKNNIFWENTAGIEGDDIYLNGFGANPRELYNNTVQEIIGTFENTSGNISTDPLFVSPETGDYHLQPNSPCINAGTQSFTTTDLDGTPRLGIPDIGAYEYNPTIPHPADTNKNFIIEESEYTPYNTSWHQNLPWSTEPTEIEIEYNTRAGFLIENGGAYTNTGAMKPLCWKPIN